MTRYKRHEEERGEELPKVTPLRKGKEKILEQEESKSDWDEDVDEAIDTRTQAKKTNSAHN